MILGITGGTGCGKTTLLNVIRDHDGLVLDCDAIYHQLLTTDPSLLSSIEARFPGTVENGTLQRKKLGAIVFADEAALQDLLTQAKETATQAGSAQAEAEALRNFFGDTVPLSSLKGHLGHTLGASGVLEMIAALEMMNASYLIPTRNLEEIAPECEGLYHLQRGMEKEISVILKNCFAFGGINTTLLFGKLKS